MVELGQQAWLGVAASLGQTAFSVFRNPFSLIGRLDDLAQDIESMQLSENDLAGDCPNRSKRRRFPPALRPDEPPDVRILPDGQPVWRIRLYRLWRPFGKRASDLLPALWVCCAERRKDLPKLWTNDINIHYSAILNPGFSVLPGVFVEKCRRDPFAGTRAIDLSGYKTMKLKLEQLESRLQALIEVRLVSALPGFQVEDLVVQKLATAMKSNLVEDVDGKKLVPNVFTLIVSPYSIDRWQQPKLLEAMINSLKIVGEEAGLKFSAPPTISIVQNSQQDENLVDVVASHQLESTADTRGMTPPTELLKKDGKDSLPQNAFLIVEGVKVFPLLETVVNIGRRLENQLVIDDPRVSRNHAQLRAIKGRYVIFDLNSTGGTFVNGQRTSQSVLYPGDVISLAGVPLVFGQDNPPPRPDLADTGPFDEISGERPTAFLNRKTGKLDDQEKKQK